MRPRLPFVGIACAAIGGVVLADWVSFPVWPLVGLWAVLLLATLVRAATGYCLGFVLVSFATVHTVGFRQAPERVMERRLKEGSCVVDVAGVVASEPQKLPYFSGKQTGSFQLAVEELRAGDERWETAASLQVVWAGALPVYGDRVRLHGTLSGLEEPRNPGQFDFADHQRRSGIFARCEAQYPQDCRIEGHGAGNPLVVLASQASHWMQAQLSLDLEDAPELATLISSMVLGLQGDTPPELKDVFRTTGTLHLFAVSGFNIAMLAVIAGFVLKPLGLGKRFVAATTIPVLVFYALVTGLSASCVRAAIMGSLVLLALLVERRGLVYNHLAAAAVLILAWDPNQFFVPGFQFSFVLVLVIVALADRISKRLEPLGRPDPFLPEALWTWGQRWQAKLAGVLAASVGVTLAAWAGSLLFTAGYFHLFSLAAIAANLVAIPLAFLVLTLGVATVLAALVAKPMAVVFSNANWGCAKLLYLTMKVFAMIPGGHVYVQEPGLHRAPACEITSLDVGSGAVVHLRSGGSDWLIDEGPAWRYANVTLPYLRSRGVNSLEAMVLTHGDALHLGAATNVFEDFHPRLVLDSPMKDRSSTRRRFHEVLYGQAFGKSFVRRGDELPLGAGRVRVLFPPDGWQRSSADDKALVLMVSAGGRRVLLMSDSGLVTERWLLDHEPDLKADVVIKGLHAKDYSGTWDFLDAVKPTAVVVQTTGREKLIEDLDEWTQRTEGQGIRVFRQDRCGAVTVRVDRGGVEVRGFLGE